MPELKVSVLCVTKDIFNSVVVSLQRRSPANGWCTPQWAVSLAFLRLTMWWCRVSTRHSNGPKASHYLVWLVLQKNALKKKLFTYIIHDHFWVEGNKSKKCVVALGWMNCGFVTTLQQLCSPLYLIFMGPLKSVLEKQIIGLRAAASTRGIFQTVAFMLLTLAQARHSRDQISTSVIFFRVSESLMNHSWVYLTILLLISRLQWAKRGTLACRFPLEEDNNAASVNIWEDGTKTIAKQQLLAVCMHSPDAEVSLYLLQRQRKMPEQFNRGSQQCTLELGPTTNTHTLISSLI